MFDIVLTPGAEKFLDLADVSLRKRILRALESLRDNPRRGNNVKPLKGRYAGCLRYRIGDWRIVYSINSQARRVYVADIAHRREVYE